MKDLIKRLEEILEEISIGSGPYSMDRLTHASNTIEAMKQLAKDGLKILSTAKSEAAQGMEGFFAMLPKGRTCLTCLHTIKCKELGHYNSDSVLCHWNPCRYAEYHGDMTPEPMFMREVCRALGWQGGTVHNAVKEIEILKRQQIKYDKIIEFIRKEMPSQEKIKSEKDEQHCSYLQGWRDAFDNLDGIILDSSQSPTPKAEPLEKLAERKGMEIWTGPTRWHDGSVGMWYRISEPIFWDDLQSITLSVSGLFTEYDKARTYLESLPDKEGK